MAKAKAPRIVTRLGTLVRTRRDALHMTQAAVAEIVGVEKAHVSNIEQGITRQPSPEVQSGLARALQLPIREIQDAIADAPGLSEDEELRNELETKIRQLAAIEDFESQVDALIRFSPELYEYVLEVAAQYQRLTVQRVEGELQSRRAGPPLDHESPAVNGE